MEFNVAISHEILQLYGLDRPFFGRFLHLRRRRHFGPKLIVDPDLIPTFGEPHLPRNYRASKISRNSPTKIPFRILLVGVCFEFSQRYRTRLSKEAKRFGCPILNEIQKFSSNRNISCNFVTDLI